MNTRSRIRGLWLGVILVPLAVLLIKFTAYDSLRLAWFARHITGTDRIVATNWMVSVGMTLTGDDAKKVVRAISSAGSGRPPFGTDWANIYDVNVKFYRGTAVLGEIEMDGGGLFLIHEQKPPFREGTGFLHDLIYKPISDAYTKKLESQ